MKIDITKLKTVPEFARKGTAFELCHYGQLTEEIKNWISFHNLDSYEKGPYTNIEIKNVSLQELFNPFRPYSYMDGFSPNLNKELHIGHLSNMVLSKAFHNMGIALNTISIYGDTMPGEISKEDALVLLGFYMEHFNHFPNKSFYASEMKYKGNLLVLETEDKYAGCHIFPVGDEKVVGIKSDNSTSYFYQDVCLAEELNQLCEQKSLSNKTLYLTGAEQENHFRLLKNLFPNIDHIPLGLVKVSGKKMGTRFGNVIYIHHFLSELKEIMFKEETHGQAEFERQLQLSYNIFAGFILKATPESDKNVVMDVVGNPKNSPGLYLSYTVARLHSAGMALVCEEKFNDIEIEYAYLKSQHLLKPNILFEAITELSNKINALYVDYHIAGNEENQKMFAILLSDLLLGMKKLGLFHTKKV